jgi:hypothetical protein
MKNKKLQIWNFLLWAPCQNDNSYIIVLCILLKGIFLRNSLGKKAPSKSDEKNRTLHQVDIRLYSLPLIIVFSKFRRIRNQLHLSQGNHSVDREKTDDNDNDDQDDDSAIT